MTSIVNFFKDALFIYVVVECLKKVIAISNIKKKKTFNVIIKLIFFH